MNYKILWQPNARINYFEELDYIYFKEIEKYEKLVIENLNLLSINPFIGKHDMNLKIYIFVISKQTSIYYSINQNEKIVDLHIFWNNQKNPEELNKLL